MRVEYFVLLVSPVPSFRPLIHTVLPVARPWLLTVRTAGLLLLRSVTLLAVSANQLAPVMGLDPMGAPRAPSA